jgi:hypothetical protein
LGEGGACSLASVHLVIEDRWFGHLISFSNMRGMGRSPKRTDEFWGAPKPEPTAAGRKSHAGDNMPLHLRRAKQKGRLSQGFKGNSSWPVCSVGGLPKVNRICATPKPFGCELRAERRRVLGVLESPHPQAPLSLRLGVARIHITLARPKDFHKSGHFSLDNGRLYRYHIVAWRDGALEGAERLDGVVVSRAVCGGNCRRRSLHGQAMRASGYGGLRPDECRLA